MSRFVKSPNLPEGKVIFAAAGERYRKKLDKALDSIGVEMLWLPDAPDIDPRLAGHADLSMLHIGANELIISKRVVKGDSFVNFLTNRGFHTYPTQSVRGPSYPYDAGLCACITGDKLIHKAEITDAAVKQFCGSHNVININQGYAKCSICVVDKNSIITSDPGVEKACSACGMNVLKIAPGNIILNGFDAGFIGGSAFKIANDVLAFTGSLNEHPDKEKILQFIHERDISTVFLTNGPIFDIGGLITLMEV